MALIKCTECGHGISDKAKFCPMCGKSFRRNRLWIVLFLALFLIGIGCFAFYFYGNQSDERNEKIQVAKEILTDNRDDLIGIATNKIKQPLLKIGLNLLMQNRCDCIIDSLAPKLADKHSLTELTKLRTGAFSNVIELTELVTENANICENCLLFRK